MSVRVSRARTQEAVACPETAPARQETRPGQPTLGTNNGTQPASRAPPAAPIVRDAPGQPGRPDEGWGLSSRSVAVFGSVLAQFRSDQS